MPFRAVVWGLAAAGVLLGLLGYFGDRTFLLALGILCGGLVFLTTSVEGVMTGQIRGRRYTYDSDDEPIMFWFAALINFGLCAAVLAYAAMLLAGYSQLASHDVDAYFHRFWHHRRR